MNAVKCSTVVITGTDTGVGKTVLAGLLTCHLRDAGISVASLKPVCSGDRDDARRLHAASDGALTLEEINPWHFRAALSPLVAARLERRELKLEEVWAHVRRVGMRIQTVIVEGAGGLLSPLGEKFDSRDLIVALRATPIVVCPNRLGAINQALLVLTALPASISRQALVVMMSSERPDLASRSNPRFLAEKIGAERVHVLPRLECPDQPRHALTDPRVRETLRALVGSIRP